MLAWAGFHYLVIARVIEGIFEVFLADKLS
jgi:hypothetical protein